MYASQRDTLHSAANLSESNAKSCGIIAQRAPTPVDEISSTLESARNLAVAVQSVVNDICGSVPVPAECSSRGLSTDGVINSLAAIGSHADTEIIGAHNAISRLRAAFGI